MVKSNRNQIMKLMRKDRRLKDEINTQRREESFNEKVKEWKSQGGEIDRMTRDRSWGFSPTSRSNVRPFKPQPKQLSESYGFPKPLGDIIKEYEDWKELEEIIQELERD